MQNKEKLEKIAARVFWLLFAALELFLLPGCAGAFCFEEAGNRYGINPVLLQAIARVESGMNPKVVNVNKNGSTDFGLMQINSSWIEPMKLYRQELLSNPCYNVMAGASILRGCIDKYGYNWQAIGCYNAVAITGRVDYSWKVYRALKRENKNNMKKIGQCNNNISESVRRNQALYFRIKSVEGMEITGEP